MTPRSFKWGRAILTLLVLLLMGAFAYHQYGGPEEVRPELGSEDPGSGRRLEDPCPLPRKASTPPSARTGTGQPPFVVGRVVLPDRTLVEGAEVRLHRWGSPSGARGELRAVTDPEGRFEFLSRPPGSEDALLVVTAAAEQGTSMPVHVPMPGESIDLGDIELLVTFEIRVVVEAPDGEALAGAEVELLATPPYPRDELSATVCLAGIADQHGIVRFPPIPRREDWSIGYQAHHPDVLFGSGDLALAPLLSNRAARIVLERGLTVVGRILGPDGRTPPPWTCVLRRVHDQDGQAVGRDGRFEIPRVSAGTTLLVETSLAEAPYSIEVPPSQDGARVDVGTIVLEEPGTIEGEVLDEDDKPLPGARVRVTDRWRKAGNVTADESGRFRFKGLPPGSYRLVAHAEIAPGDEIDSAPVDAATGDVSVQLRISRAGTLLLRFHAADRAGEPANLNLAIVVSIDDRPAHGGSVTTTFRCRPEAGAHRMSVWIPGYKLQDLGMVTVSPDHETVVEVPLQEE